MIQKIAALLIIGDEILAGRVKDENLPFLASELSKIGIKITQARFTADSEQEIISNILELHTKVDYLFLTGGIGPTHDDITSKAVAEAFNEKYELNLEAYQIIKKYPDLFGIDHSENGIKMAYLPSNATLLNNPAGALGFRINNTFVMPGVPFLMQQIFNDNKFLLESSAPIKSKSLITNMPESIFALELGKLQNRYSMLNIGSYPKLDCNNKWMAEIVVTSNDSTLLAQAFQELEILIQKLRG